MGAICWCFASRKFYPVLTDPFVSSLGQHGWFYKKDCNKCNGKMLHEKRCLLLSIAFFMAIYFPLFMPTTLPWPIASLC